MLFRSDLAGISVNVNGEKTNRILGEKTFCVYGREYLKDGLLGLDFHISPESFYQVNHAQAQRLYSCALDMAELKENERALDLYCGTGTITLLLAKRCAHALGNEIIPQAVENARENARRNGIENVSFILGDAGKAAFRLSNAEISPDLIVTDPPRKGMDEKAVLACCRMGPRRIVYISCDPASLARDARLFEEKGYKMTKAKAFDMFPATANVETVVLLSKLNTKQHIEVELNLDELDLTAAESKATYDEIKAYVLEKYGSKVSSLYISQIKRKCGLDVGQNYNLSKKEDAKVPQCPPEKEAAIIEALKHFQMI